MDADCEILGTDSFESRNTEDTLFYSLENLYGAKFVLIKPKWYAITMFSKGDFNFVVKGGPWIHLVTRVNSTNVLDELLRIGGIGRRMNSKVKVSRNKCTSKVNLGVQPGLLSICPTPSLLGPYI
jgi:hypothetical protein